MSDDEIEWGPWIEHDGKGCPCVGMFVHTQFMQNYPDYVGVAGDQCRIDGIDPSGLGSAWVWKSDPRYHDSFVVRYRIRKPKGMKILEGLLENLPKSKDGLIKDEPVREKETTK